MKKLRTLLMGGLLLAAAHVMGYTISVAPTEIMAGGSANLVINLANTETNLTAYQMKLFLPEGVTVQKGSNGKYDFTPNLERHAGTFTLTVKDAADGSVLIAVFSTNKDALAGTSGELISLPIDVASTVTTSLQGSIKNIEFTTVQSQAQKHDDVDFTLTLVQPATGDIDLSQYNLVKEFDLAQYNAPTYMVSDGTDQRGTAWEVGNKVQQKIFNVIEPEDFSGYLAIQAYYTGGKSKGWWINTGLQSYAAPRSAAMLNRKAGDLIVFESSGNDITTAMTLYNGEGNPDGPFTYQQSADGTKYYVTLTGDGQVGFCGLKNGSPITRIAIYEPLVRPISVKADDLTMTYGEPLPTLTWTATRDGQPTTVSGEPVLTPMATDQSKPGTYTICCNQGTVTTDGALFANGKLTIDKATVTVTAPTLTINKGEAIPDLTPTYTGFVNGWTADMLNTQAICTTTATSDSPAGTYLVTYRQNPNSGGYYNFNMVEGTLTIMPQLPEGTLYYWIGSLEQGGRAVAQDGESVGRPWAGLSTISLLNEKANVDTWGYVDIALDEPLQAGDKISITAFRYQDDDAEGSIYLRFANGTVVDDEYVFPNIHEGYSQEPGEHTWTVGEEAAGSQSIRLTRGKADADLFITNIVIVRGDGSVTPIAPTTDYSLAGLDLVAASGTQSELVIALTNSGAVRLCQFDLSLPEGVTVTSKANGKPNITLTDRAESHSLSVTRLANGDYRVVVSSLEGDDFAGNSGPLVKAALTIADGMADGEYNVYVRNIVLSLPDGNNLNKVKPADATSKLTIRNYKPGDVDNDGEVDVNDVGCTINYILEQVPDVFIFEAADMDKDLAIDVNDVGYIINTILGIGNGSRLAEGTFAAAMQATSPGLSLMATGTGYALNGQRMGNIAACQFDVALSDGAVLDGVELSTQAADHVATFRKIADGTYRVVVYSPTGSGLGYEGNNLLRLQTHGSSIAVSNIILSTTSLHKVAMPDLGASTTGIASVYGSLSIKAIGDGRLVVTASGDYRLSVVTAGGTACGELNVKQGTNEFGGFVPGVYIINNKKIVIR